MSILEALIQGIVQGLSEFLPISSSGHLSLLQYFFGISGEASASYSILLHFGTMIAVFAAFYKLIWRLILEFFSMVGDIFKGRFSLKSASPERRMVLLIIVAETPLLFFYLFSGFYNSLSSDNDIIVEGICFLFTSLLLFISDRVVKGKKTSADMTFKDALVIGTVQGIAPLPGISRSGSTIATGLMCGLSREYAVSFSFILGIPPVFMANVMEIVDICANGAEGAIASLEPIQSVIGIVVAAAVGFASIKAVNYLVKKDKFTVFAWYTLVLGLVTVVLGIAHLVIGHPVFTFKI